ncbi:ornithine cyclodeaminase family protein [Janthinobacterium agaricidamnosum]|uniref:Shikimate / quinate 5-dehydrogenase family protein n=1 Tax=Janthinobacterium agaricidamnosum NBRC 102515 = DSM 9628 TaxID=1349767 RepID=W0V3K5_9BURK|nr:ornithine cyclodeaminase family protein [Janthinobacterium agaricidamnosum]CDG82195.1 shikimate / quinate 5-dehydrogenase family protein [Janthinobacterium agaricidamnosum NBRC 102515 = DSM 9628]
MFFVSEETAARVVGIGDAIAVVEDTFRQLFRGKARAYPAVMAKGPGEATLFGVKCGALDNQAIYGAKLGSYWPDNRDAGLPAHALSTLLLDAQTGFPKALIAATYLTSLRTAAANGVAMRHLSRADSRSVAMVGAGHQSWFELQAAIAVRPIDRVRIWNRDIAKAEQFAERVRRELGIQDVAACGLERAVSEADIVITVTAARQALVSREWVRPGTHISAMGADALGKQELDVALVASARLFTDLLEQSVTLGEFEAAIMGNHIRRQDIVALGAVIDGAEKGRVAPDDITIFDSSGIGLQDLAIGALALRRAVELKLVAPINF